MITSMIRVMIINSPKPKYSLLQKMLRVLLRPRAQIVTHNNSRAGVPSKDCIIIPGGTNSFSLLEPFHRLAEPVVSRVVRARRAFRQPRLSPSLPYDSCVVDALVLIT